MSGEGDLVREIADMLYRIHANYDREGSFSGSRFEGEELEIVQARRVLRLVRERDAAPAVKP